jgi:hypothetical protein
MLWVVDQKEIDEINIIVVALSKELKTIEDPEEFVETTALTSDF